MCFYDSECVYLADINLLRTGIIVIYTVLYEHIVIDPEKTFSTNPFISD